MTLLDELFAFVSFDDRDRIRLRELHPRIAPQFDAIADRFYAALLASPGASAVLSGPAQAARLRTSLIDWMSSGLSGPHDERFYDKRSRIGRRHVAVGLGSQYMFSATAVLRQAYRDCVTALYPADEALAVMSSVDKLLDCELAIMVKHYELDSADQLIARERKSQADRVTAMQTMSSGLAHEIRNPLNAAKLQLQLLERRLHRAADDPKLIEPLEQAQKEIERLTVLLNEFLVFARPPDLHVQEHELIAVVRQVLDGERDGAEQRGVTLELDAEPAEVLAQIDVAKVHQLVFNLVRNACEAASAGGRVGVAIRVDDVRCVIRVTDDGPGIPEHVRPRIYEPFFSTKESGTGLGMSIVHSLVTAHGGSIDLATGPRGTAFEIAIPRWRSG